MNWALTTHGIRLSVVGNTLIAVIPAGCPPTLEYELDM